MDIKNTLLKLIATGLTQTQIAQAIGCSQPTVSELLAEKIGKSRPSYKVVQGLTDLAIQHGIDPENPEEEAQPNLDTPHRRASDPLNHLP